MSRRGNRGGGDESGPTTTGRWTAEEHDAFVEGLKRYGREWRKVAELVPTRTVVQIRTHAQKYYLKLSKEYGEDAAEKAFQGGYNISTEMGTSADGKPETSQFYREHGVGPGVQPTAVRSAPIPQQPPTSRQQKRTGPRRSREPRPKRRRTARGYGSSSASSGEEEEGSAGTGGGLDPLQAWDQSEAFNPDPLSIPRGSPESSPTQPPTPRTVDAALSLVTHKTMGNIASGKHTPRTMETARWIQSMGDEGEQPPQSGAKARSGDAPPPPSGGAMAPPKAVPRMPPGPPSSQGFSSAWGMAAQQQQQQQQREIAERRRQQRAQVGAEQGTGASGGETTVMGPPPPHPTAGVQRRNGAGAVALRRNPVLPRNEDGKEDGTERGPTG